MGHHSGQQRWGSDTAQRDARDPIRTRQLGMIRTETGGGGQIELMEDGEWKIGWTRAAPWTAEWRAVPAQSGGHEQGRP